MVAPDPSRGSRVVMLADTRAPPMLVLGSSVHLAVVPFSVLASRLPLWSQVRVAEPGL